MLQAAKRCNKAGGTIVPAKFAIVALPESFLWSLDFGALRAPTLGMTMEGLSSIGDICYAHANPPLLAALIATLRYFDQ